MNPIGITQQFILQGMVKKPKHIWYFILTTGVVNMIFGYFVYYGVMTIINGILNRFLSTYGWALYSLELMFGFGLLIFGIISLIKKILSAKKDKHPNAEKLIEEKEKEEEEEIKSKIKRVTPLALIGIGVVSTISELTSAVPYFAFLAVLVTYHLSFPILTLLFIFYNIIYMAPFMILYFIYIASKQKFDSIYTFFKKTFKRYSGVLIPALMLVISAIIMIDAVTNIIGLV